jgi:hypothetical protein
MGKHKQDGHYHTEFYRLQTQLSQQLVQEQINIKMPPPPKHVLNNICEFMYVCTKEKDKITNYSESHLICCSKNSTNWAY